MKLSNISIRLQLMLLTALAVLAVVLTGVLAAVQLTRSHERLEAVHDQRLAPLADLKVVSDMYAVTIVDSANRVLFENYAWPQAVNQIRDAELLAARHWQAYRRLPRQGLVLESADKLEILMNAARVEIDSLKVLLDARDEVGLRSFVASRLYWTVDPISQEIARLVRLELEAAEEAHQADADAFTKTWMVLAASMAGLLMVLMSISMRILKSIRDPLMQAKGVAERIAAGDLGQAVPEGGASETGQLLSALAVMQHQLQGTEDQRWVKSQLTDIAAGLQQTEAFESMGRSLLSMLAPRLGVGHAALYTATADGELVLLSAYGLQERKELKQRLALGEGLVGQCALERAPITLLDPPADYVRIGSGTGDGVPRAIMLLPIMLGEFLLGVLELAAFHRFTDREVALVDAVLPLVAMNLEIIERRVRTQRLLEETQEQAQRMEKQAAQLEEQAVEMEAQQAELMETEAWFRGVIESAPDGMLVVDESGTIILCNREAAQAFGYDAEELLGQSVEMLVPDDIRAGHPKHRQDFMSSHGYRPMESGLELRGRRKDGTEFAAEFGLSMLPGRSVRGRCVAVSVRDISARHQIAAQAKANERQMRFILDSSPVAVGIVTIADNKLVYSNKASQLLFETQGLAVDEIKPIEFYLEADALQKVHDLVLKDQTIINEPMNLRTQNGRPLKVLASFIRMDYDGQQAMLSWFFDVTHLNPAVIGEQAGNSQSL